jgi:hypothetical protein
LENFSVVNVGVAKSAQNAMVVSVGARLSSAVAEANGQCLPAAFGEHQYILREGQCSLNGRKQTIFGRSLARVWLEAGQV